MPVASSSAGCDQGKLTRSPRRRQYEAACSIMATHLLEFAYRYRFASLRPDLNSGMAVRVERGRYVFAPQDDPRLAPFAAAVKSLGPDFCFTFNSTLVQGVVKTFVPDMRSVALSPTVKVQVVDRMEELCAGGIRFAQKAAFVRTEGCLIVWFNKAEEFQDIVTAWENILVAYVRAEISRTGVVQTSRSLAATSSTMSPAIERSTSSAESSEEHEQEQIEEKAGQEEEGDAPRNSNARPAVHYQDAYTGLAVALGTSIAFSLEILAYLAFLQTSSFAFSCLARSCKSIWPTAESSASVSWSLCPSW